MENPYENRDWLYDQYIVKNKSSRDIGREQSVSYSVILKRLNRFGIKKTKEQVFSYAGNRKKTMVDVSCRYCGEITHKSISYYEKRLKGGYVNFYCDSQCFGLDHSDNMSGEGNPNIGNKTGVCPNDYRTKEQMSEHARNAWERHRKTGVYEERIRKLHEGSDRFFNTPEGKDLRKRQGYLSLKSQRRKATSIEVAMRDELTRRFIHFREQEPIKERFVADFFLPDYKIVIECDGDYWHTLPGVAEKDDRKNKVIHDQGYSLFRFWGSQINKDVEACVDIVMAQINDADVA